MIFRPRLQCCALLALLLSGGLLRATETIFPDADLALPLNDRGVGARALALGSAYVGLGQDTASLYWNPGGLAYLGSAELSTHLESGLGGLIQDVAELGIPMDSWGNLGLSADYVDSGSFQGRDQFGNLVASYIAEDWGADLGWALRFTPSLGIGIVGRFTEETLDTTVYQAFSGGAGFLWKATKEFWLGADLANLGSSVAGSSQDSSVDAGFSWHPDLGPGNDTALTASYRSEIGGTQFVGGGIEDVLYSILALRVGYQYNTSETDLNGIQGVTAGVGLNAEGFSLDYAYLPFGQVGTSQTLSLCYHFPAAAVATAPPQSRKGTTASLAEQIHIYHDRVIKSPKDAASWWTLGNLFNRNKEYSKANYCYKIALRLLPNNAKIANWYKQFRAKHPDLK